MIRGIQQSRNEKHIGKDVSGQERNRDGTKDSFEEKSDSKSDVPDADRAGNL